MTWDATWILASAQSTNEPFIQIFPEPENAMGNSLKRTPGRGRRPSEPGKRQFNMGVAGSRLGGRRFVRVVREFGEKAPSWASRRPFTPIGRAALPEPRTPNPRTANPRT